MGWWRNLFGSSTKDPEKLYKRALRLFGQDKYREAAAALEEAARVAPGSAPGQFTLGVTYSRIAEEYDSEEEIHPWAQKSRDSFAKALEFAATSGGLDQKQISIAQDFIVAFDRIAERDSPSLPEEQRKIVYADFMDTRESEFLFGTNICQDFVAAAGSQGGGLAAMVQSIHQSSAQAEEATYTKIGERYGLSKGQLMAIVEEGKQKKWPFRSVGG